MKNQLYKTVGRNTYTHYANGRQATWDSFAACEIKKTIILPSGLVSELIGLYHNSICANIHFFIKSLNITVIATDEPFDLEDYFTVHHPNYNSFWIDLCLK